jgi:hypothetical protein
MTDNDDSTGYVHDPESFHERVDSEESEDSSPRTTKAYLDGPNRDPSEQEFGQRGWVLVGMLFIAFVVVPATILYLPQARPVIASLGLTFRDAYLVLPLVPALVLGAIAVWVAVGKQTA